MERKVQSDEKKRKNLNDGKKRKIRRFWSYHTLKNVR